MKKRILKYINKFIAFVMVLSFVPFFGALASQDQLYIAFARFIKTVYDNTETADKGSELCIFGSDDVSLKIVSVVDNKILRHLSDRLDEKSNLKSCRLIYVAKDKKRITKYSMELLSKSNSLTIAIFPSFVSDGGMVFIDVGRRNFELTVNGAVFRDSRVRLDSSITGLIVERR